ncbi:hypothetical protein Patl1_07181 [Pistacia atlantica]|uniref:Uncharacterized protein n=1 Tax=Pistacia atlantica TaxID=434234 RepID=A0ACC1AFT4_9ROSI|nr:hypothetical protein Patl1_07181 [Pistacia atlantica]
MLKIAGPDALYWRLENLRQMRAKCGTDADRNDFELITLPALLPVPTTAAGETLLLLVKQLELISNKEWKWFDNNVF